MIYNFTFFSCIKYGRKISMIIAFLCFSLASIFAQSHMVSGTITDDEGITLPGANILEKGTSNGVVSDLDGKFSISISEGATLVISYIGYQTQEILVGELTTLDITLSIGNELEEVVVIGYGTTRKSDLTGAVASISNKDFEKQPVFRVEEALQGRAAGVQVSKNSGAPGADVKIRIRGANSINGSNQPLVVIDGVIGADLRSINTNDIASMEILKDASATAIYGSRGANGVVLISTKRGKGKPSINIDAFSSISSISKTLDLLSPEEFAAINNTNVIDGGTDYQNEYFRTGYTKNLQMSLSGKRENIGYFLSGNILDQTGTSINTGYRRYSLRSNIDAQFSDKLSVQLNISGSNEKSLNLIGGGVKSSPDSRAGIVGVVGWDPTLPIKDADGNYNLLGGGSSLINPVAQRLEAQNYATIMGANSNLNLSYDITSNLNLTVIGGLLYRSTFGENYNGVPSGTALGRITGASAGGSSRYSTVIQNSNILTWTQSYNSHNLKFTGLFETQKSVNKRLSAGGGEFAIPANFYSLNLGTQPSAGASLSKFEIQSYMGRAEYNLDRKLFVTGTIRADVSSKFRPGKQVGVFPSLALAYQFRNLFNDNIESLKLRAGYGEVGNQDISPFSTYSTLNTGLNYPLDGTSDTRGLGLTGGNLGNSNLTWETTKQTNIGVDITFLSGKATLALNKYWKNTTDLLLDVPVADFLGGGFVTQNVGEVFNGGWEAGIDFSAIRSENFDWNINANYSYNDSEVKSLYGGVDELLLSPVGGISNTAGNYIRVKVGEPLGQFFGVTSLGTYKTGDSEGTPGNARYKENEDGVILDVIGNGVPKHTWAVNNTFTLGRFDMNFLLRGSHGFDIMNITRGKISMSGGTQGGPTYGEFRNRWTPENETDIPAGGDLFVNSTRFIENGDFVRLSNLAFGFNLDSFKALNKIRVYASAQNLFTLTKYKGYDPEASTTDVASGTASSIDYGANPNSRTLTFGVNITF